MRPTSEYNPKGKRAIITGGARGIGLEFADQLLRAGARVCICDIDVQGGKRVAEKLRDKYLVRKDSVYFAKCDVTLKHDWAKMWDEAEDALGGKIEILCNNAGVPPKVGMDINLAVMTIGATFGVTHALERMGRSKGGVGGRIIMTASTAGLTVGKDHFGLIQGLGGGGYAVSKHENVVLTRLFPHFSPKPSEDGVKMYALCPAFVPTRLVLDIDIQDGNQVKENLRDRETRPLSLEEVGKAMIQSMKKDIDGACYFIYPDLPIIEVPDEGFLLLCGLYITGKVAAALSMDSLSKKGCGIILFFVFYTVFYILHHILTSFLLVISHDMKYT